MTQVVKNPPPNAGDISDTGSIPGCERSPGGGLGNPLQYSCLENPHEQRSLAGYSPWGFRVRLDWSNLARMHSGVGIWQSSFSAPTRHPVVLIHAYQNSGRLFAKLEFLFLKVIIRILIVKQGILIQHGKIKIHRVSEFEFYHLHFQLYGFGRITLSKLLSHF